MANTARTSKARPDEPVRLAATALRKGNKSAGAALSSGKRKTAPPAKSTAGAPGANRPGLGVRKLDDAVATYTQLGQTAAKTPPTNKFNDAYTSMIRSVPEPYRLSLLRTMRRSIDEVARLELHTTLEEAEVAGQVPRKVDTADFVAQLERQEHQRREAELAAQDLVPGPAMAARLAISPQALSGALKTKRMFALYGPSGAYVYPAFFADPLYDRRSLERVCKALGDLPGASKWDFFTSGRASLGGQTPLQALAKGKLETVMALANAFRDE